MKISNSSRIAIVFSFFTFLISLFFVLIFNFFTFHWWYDEEKNEINNTYIQYNNLIKKLWNRIKYNKLRYLVKYKNIKKNYEEIFFDIYKAEDNKFYIIKKFSNNLFLEYDVDIFVRNQILQIKLWIFLIFIFTFLSFILSKFIFSKLILKEIYLLSKKIEKLDIYKDNYIENNFYDADIKWIVKKTNLLLKKIYENKENLKYFNSQVSHEFKTPLMIITSELEFLQLSWLENNSLEEIQVQIDKLDNLLNSFILLTKIDNSKLATAEIKIDNLIQEILVTLNKIYKNKNIDLRIDIKECELDTNKELFYILAKNLIENAFKYTNKNWFISIGLDCSKLEIKNSVSPSNIDTDKIFDIFYRNSTANQWFGIGLYIVKKIVEILKYKIKVLSKENEFSLIIKLKW